MLIALHVVTIAFAATMIFLLTRMVIADRKSRVLLFIESELTTKPLLATFLVSLSLGFIPMLILVA